MSQPVIGNPPPRQLPGTPLPGGGVAGIMLASWTLPPQTVFEGWLTPGEDFEPPDWPMYSFRAIYPIPPDDAGTPPEQGSRWTVIQACPPGGWASEIW
jgi:hypothetical protein